MLFVVVVVVVVGVVVVVVVVSVVVDVVIAVVVVVGGVLAKPKQTVIKGFNYKRTGPCSFEPGLSMQFL